MFKRTLIALILSLALLVPSACSAAAWTCSQDPAMCERIDGPPPAFSFGDGSEGAKNCSGNLQGTHYYSSFTIDNGNTCTVTYTGTTAGTAIDVPQGGAFLFVTGTCTIAGTFTAKGIFTDNFSGQGGGTGGSGGGADAANAGVAGKNSFGLNNVMAQGPAGGAIGTVGNNGIAITTSGQEYVARHFDLFDFLAGGHGGAGGAGTGAGGTGGAGGGAIVLVCGAINFTGTVDVSGGNGGNGNAGASNSGGGGGGGGGFAIMATRNFIANSGTFTVAGGAGGAAGGAGAGAGGIGGTGWSKQFTLN